uniref:MADF domain-containing protein n=1 Tax=Angiostrongylus cantonensis TaxID=6313 RepID=A0A158PAQ5_ANGCA
MLGIDRRRGHLVRTAGGPAARLAGWPAVCGRTDADRSRMDYPTKCHLIKLVEEEESIWNTGVEDYARLDKKNESWNRIYKEMTENYNFSGSMLELKTTWKNLRDQWRKNSLNKAPGSCKSWTFEKHLLFLATAQNEAMDVPMKKEFIALIKQEELLWNTECKDYYRLDKKNLSWSRILTKLEKKGFRGGLLELKAAWKVLRDTKRRTSMQPNASGKAWIYEKDLEFLNDASKSESVQFSPRVENDSKLHSLVDSPRSSVTADDMIEEATSIAASDEGNEGYFVPVSEAQENGTALNDAESSRKRSYGGGLAAKRRKMECFHEGLDMIREITVALRERLSSVRMDKFDRYGAFIASSLREMSEPVAKRKMAELMDCLLSQENRT